MTPRPARPRPRAATASPATNAQVARLRERLQRECTRRLTLEELARDAGLSSSHLARMFRRVTGETVHGCQARLRLQRACSLLTETTTSITAIALELGYAHSSHFGAAFRRAYGMTPRQYARLHRRIRTSNRTD